jgi:hypothetical protein
LVIAPAAIAFVFVNYAAAADSQEKIDSLTLRQFDPFSKMGKAMGSTSHLQTLQFQWLLPQQIDYPAIQPAALILDRP